MDETLFEVLEIISEKAAEIMDECAVRFGEVREWERNETQLMLRSNGSASGCERPNGERRQLRPRENGTKRIRSLVGQKCRGKRRSSLCGYVKRMERPDTQ